MFCEVFMDYLDYVKNQLSTVKCFGEIAAYNTGFGISICPWLGDEEGEPDEVESVSDLYDNRNLVIKLDNGNFLTSVQ
jgi:hypothetical protein